MVINHEVSTTYTDRHIKMQIILLVDLLFTRKDGENRTPPVHINEAYKRTKMQKRTGNMTPYTPLSTWSGSALGGAV
jgi:hypothetical protein